MTADDERRCVAIRSDGWQCRNHSAFLGAPGLLLCDFHYGRAMDWFGGIMTADDERRCVAIRSDGWQCRNHSAFLGAPGLLLCDFHYGRAMDWFVERRRYDIQEWDRTRPERDAKYAAEKAAEEKRVAKEIAAEEATSVVYFVRKANGEIKIGFTSNFRARFAGLTRQYGALEILGAMAGGRRRETEMHNRFAKSRIDKSEWFKPTEDLIAFALSRDVEVIPLLQNPNLKECA